MTGCAVVSAMAGWVGAEIVFGVLLVIAYASFVGWLVLLCGVRCVASFGQEQNCVRAAMAVAFAGAFLAAVVFSLGVVTAAAMSPPLSGDKVMIGIGWLLYGTFVATFLGGLIAGCVATGIACLVAVIRPFLPAADPMPAGHLAIVLGAIVSFPLWVYVIPPLVFLTVPTYLIRKAEELPHQSRRR